jgi:hypothetical protein
MRSSRLQKASSGLGSRMLSSRRSSSSSRFIIDFCLKMMLLIVLTGELAVEMKESLSVLVLARDDAEDDLRNEVRMLCGEKRARMVWKREGCMVTVGGSVI